MNINHHETCGVCHQSVCGCNKLEIALRKLVDKLEVIERDVYTKDRYGGVYTYWKNELKEAKYILEALDWGRIAAAAEDAAGGFPSVTGRVPKKSDKSHGIDEELCTGYSTRDVDLFDVKQLEKINESFDKIRKGIVDTAIVKEDGAEHRTIEIVNVEDRPFKNELDE